MVSGTLAVSTTPASLQTGAVSVSGQRLFVQIIGTGTVIIGGKAGVTAGNGIQIASTNGPVDIGGIHNTLLADVWVATTSATAVLMWTAN